MSEVLPVHLPEKSKWSDLALYLFGGFGVYLVLSTLLSFWITDFKNIWAVFSIYLLNGFCLGGSLYFWGIRRGKVTWAALGIYPPVWQWRWLWIAILVTALLIPLRGILALGIDYLLGGNSLGLQVRLDLFTAGSGFSWLNFALSLLGIGIIAPISEEFYFRGLLQSWMQGRLSLWVRVAASGLLFSLAHFDSPAVAASALIIGLVNAFAFEKSKSLWLPVLFHMLTNSLAVVILYMVLLVTQLLNIHV
jgi:membrane protease YdiL (CAAX protease family)